MATKELLCFLFVCFFALGSAANCTYKSDCFGKNCCGDGVCRLNCFGCWRDSECGSNERCCGNTCAKSSDICLCTGNFICGRGEQCCKHKCTRDLSSCSCTFKDECGLNEECCNSICSYSCSCSYDNECGSLM